MAGLMTIIWVQRTRSRGHFRTSKLSRAVCSALRLSSPQPAQKWPERPRSRFEPLGTRFRPLLRTLEPSAQPHRSKWHHGSPDESVMLSACRLLQPSTQNLAKQMCDAFFSLRTFVKLHHTVPGSHRALPGDLGGGRGGPRSAPTPRDGSDVGVPARERG